MKMLSVSRAAVMSLYKANSTLSTFKPSRLSANKIKDFTVTISSEARIKLLQSQANSSIKRLVGAPVIEKEYVPPHGTMFRGKINRIG